MMGTGGQLKWLTLLVTLWAVLNTAASSDIIDLMCESEEDCSTFRNPFVNSTCVDGSCECVLESGNKTTCKPVNVNKASWKMGNQCPCDLANSYCNPRTQFCVCKDGFLPSRERKVCVSKSVPLGQTCEVDEQCIEHDHFSHCDEKHRNCTCLNHFALLEDACHSVIAAPNATNSTCEKDADCAKLTANATCHESRCICGKGFIGDGAASNCLPVARYEGNCTESSQCIATLGVGSVCHEGKCVCIEAFFPFQDHARTGHGARHEVQTLCKRKILYGSSCESDKECYQFHHGPHEQRMECYGGGCVCTRNYKERDGYCYPINSATSLQRIPIWITLFVAVLAFLSCKCLC